MAQDAVMLAQSRSGDAVLWRFYGWSEPAVTFGYSQKWEWVRSSVGPFEGALVRRWTGGGIVDHRKDLTYAISIPASHALHRHPALELYRELHALIADILNVEGIQSTLAPCPGKCADGRTAPTGVCFQAPEPYDVIDPVSRAKRAGAAMKRNRDGVLIQGSLSLPGSSIEFRTQIIEAFGKRLPGWLHLPPSEPADPLPMQALGDECRRYASEAWNRRR